MGYKGNGEQAEDPFYEIGIAIPLVR